MQMVSFVLKSGQILPRGEMRNDKKLLVSESFEVRIFHSNLITRRTSANGYVGNFH